ncbi:MAG: hypothetical protein PHI96_09365, partial [Desulfovibrio sp.]|nr:hypothetical protein [Desulfovibrio sp.]
MKRLWLAGVVIVAVLGFFLARQTGVLDTLSGNSPEQQQNTARGSGSSKDNAGADIASTDMSQSSSAEADG